MYAELINRHALANDVRPDIVACIILQESNGDTFAARFEPDFYRTYLKDKTRDRLSGWVPSASELPSFDTEKMFRSTSWGLMQVMGDTARWCAGVKDRYLSRLVDPDRGIDAGCRVLAYYLAKEKGDYTRALARYNAGSVSERGLQYAKKVLTRLENREHLTLMRE